MKRCQILIYLRLQLISTLLIQTCYIMLNNNHTIKQLKNITLIQYNLLMTQRPTIPPISFRPFNKPIDSLTIYLPAYLRLKFKNFVSLDLPNLSGQMNATLIYSIYYGSLFEQLALYGISQNDQQMIRRKMENEFVMNFSKDDAIQLTEGKIQKVKRGKEPKRREKSEKQKQQAKVKIKRNIEMTVKPQDKQKMIKFTLRKNFTVHLKSSVFWTPFQIIDSILEITVQSLKLKTKDKPLSLTIQINLMDTRLGPSKISYSQQKKFGQYGIVRSGLQSVYSNNKLVACNPEVFDVKVKLGEDKVRKFERKVRDQRAVRFRRDYEKVMGDEKYSQETKEWYKEEYARNKAKYKYVLTGGLLDPQETALILVQQHGSPTKQQATPSKLLPSRQDQQSFHQINKSTKILQPHHKQSEHHINIKKTESNQNYEQTLFQQQPDKTMNDKKKGGSQQQKLQACKYASFKIPLYKLPFTSLATIFLPLWLLAVLNLGVFFQNENLADRIACIASLVLAFIAFVPTIRQQIPPSPSIVFVEILVYLVAATSLLALAQSIHVHQTKNFVFQEWEKDPWFMISMIINIIVCAIVIILMSVHYCVWQPRYKKKPDTGSDSKFERKIWSNRPCEKEFRHSFKNKLINKIQNKNENGEVLHQLYEVIDDDDSIRLMENTMKKTV